MTAHSTLERRRRLGWTLVEMICVISVMTVLMGIVTTFLNTAFQFSADTRAEFQQHATVNRLATQFRADVRGCVALNVEGEQLKLLKQDGGSIVYERSRAGIVRIEDVSSQSLVRDGFWLDETWQLAWGKEGAVATMTLTPQSDANRDIPILIKAAIGGDAKPVQPRT